MAARRHRTTISGLPRLAVSPEQHDPDPVHPDHFMFVLAWQVAHPHHKLARMETYALARSVRARARQMIEQAVVELDAEDSNDADYSAEQHHEMMEMIV